MKKKISIIMNCHNGARYLNKSINSIINQNYKNWELIFFDNHSNDNSRQIAKGYKDKRIKFFKSNKFLSLYEARNLAVSKATGRYICFCDTDDWWFKSKIKIQVNFIKKYKDINFVYSNLFVFNEKTKQKQLYFNTPMPSGKITQYLLNNYKLGILSVMMDRKLFINKKFNKKYNIIGDFDFFINLSLRQKFYCIQKPLGVYRMHDNNFSKKINIYAKEMENWLKINNFKFTKLKYSLINIKFTLFKLKLKNIFFKNR
tara:strand:- start:1310 stop:2083 length:774 start_codon:yes stop_codon:yes gene_type:complete